MFGHGEAGHVAASCVVASSGGQGKDRQGAASCVKAVKVGTGGARYVMAGQGMAVKFRRCKSRLGVKWYGGHG